MFITLWIAIFCFMIFVVTYMINYKEVFAGDPFTFGANQMGNVECQCVQQEEDGLPAKFWFNDTALTFGEREYSPMRLDDNNYFINITDFEKAFTKDNETK